MNASAISSGRGRRVMVIDGRHCGSRVARRATRSLLDLLFEAQRRQRRADVVVHLGGRALPVEALEDPALVVEADERRRLLVVDLEPLAHGLLAVVLALDELGTVDVADVVVLGPI